MTEYRALKPFTNGNTYVGRGVVVELTTKQAEFLQRGGFIEPAATVHATPAALAAAVEPEAKPAAKTAPKKKAAE